MSKTVEVAYKDRYAWNLNLSTHYFWHYRSDYWPYGAMGCPSRMARPRAFDLQQGVTNLRYTFLSANRGDNAHGL